LKHKSSKRKRKDESGDDDKGGFSGKIDINLDEDSAINELGLSKGQKMEATGGSSTMYQKQTNF
jgi:hypothetical protein